MGGPSSSGKGKISMADYKKAMTYKEADKLGEKITPKKWFDNLPSNHEAAINVYTGSSYQEINGYLRGTVDHISDPMKKRIDYITESLSKASLKENIIVYRGADTDALGKNFNPANYKKMKGAIISDKGFMSTSLVKETAFSGDVKFEIRAKAGSKAAFVKPISSHKSENEVLFNRGTKMKIASITKDEHGTYRVVADIV